MTLRGFEDDISTYLGNTVWGRQAERVRQTEDAWTVSEGTHEPLIAQDTAQAVMAQRRTRQHVASKPATYLLTGTMFCKDCGSGYVGDAKYYTCSGRRKRGSSPCSNGRIVQHAIEGAIQRAVRDVVIRPEFAEEYMQAARTHLKGDTGNSDEANRIRKQLGKNERALQRWIQTFEGDGPTADAAIGRIRALEAEKTELSQRLAELEAAQKVIPLAAGGSDEFLRELLERFDEVMSLGNIQDRKALLSHVVQRVEIGPRSRDLRRARSSSMQPLVMTR